MVISSKHKWEYITQACQICQSRCSTHDKTWVSDGRLQGRLLGHTKVAISGSKTIVFLTRFATQEQTCICLCTQNYGQTRSQLMQSYFEKGGEAGHKLHIRILETLLQSGFNSQKTLLCSHAILTLCHDHLTSNANDCQRLVTLRISHCSDIRHIQMTCVAKWCCTSFFMRLSCCAKRQLWRAVKERHSLSMASWKCLTAYTLSFASLHFRITSCLPFSLISRDFLDSINGTAGQTRVHGRHALQISRCQTQTFWGGIHGGVQLMDQGLYGATSRLHDHLVGDWR